jgi:hypothetical protein
MNLVMVCGKFRAPTLFEIEQNVMRARELSLRIWKLERFAVFCPHGNTGVSFEGCAPDKVWLEGALEFLRRSDACVFMHDWHGSAGTAAEHVEAERVGKKIFYECPTLELQLLDWDNEYTKNGASNGVVERHAQGA